VARPQPRQRAALRCLGRDEGPVDQIARRAIVEEPEVAADHSGGGARHCPIDRQSPTHQPVHTHHQRAEPASQSPGGKVCTHAPISGAAEFGREHQDDASRAAVRTQGPYWPAAWTKDDDARLHDAGSMAGVGIHPLTDAVSAAQV